MSAVTFGNRPVGSSHPPLVVAEVGINHNGDMTLAHGSIDAAHGAGAEAVKFQNYDVADFVVDESLTLTYRSGEGEVTESQLALFKRCQLAPEDLQSLREHCESLGLLFLSTPTSTTGVDDLVRIGAHGMKNGSDFLTNRQLVKAMGATGLPTIVSTGMATLAEIDDAVRAFEEGGGKELVLLHCTSSYPTPADDVHLRKIPALGRAFGRPVGLSDHTEGTTAAVGAVVVGACLIEKHFTLDRSLPGPDHWFSSDPEELRALVEATKAASRMLGSPELVPTASEEQSRREFRLSCVAADDLPSGKTLTEADVTFARPGTGSPPRDLPWIVGRVLAEAVAKGTPLLPRHFR